jgi:hypothetical protein
MVYLQRPAASIIALFLLTTLSGCGKSYKVAEVDGTLTIGGKPGNKIHIQFVPINPDGTKLPISNADTDEQGKFTLQMREGNNTINGAVVGSSRVVLSDLQFAEANGQGVRLRIKPEYTIPGSTPLRQEVAEGKQTIDIKLP